MKTNNQINQNYNETELLTYMDVLYASKDETIVDEIIDELVEALTQEWDKSTQTQIKTISDNIQTMKAQLTTIDDEEKHAKLSAKLFKACESYNSGEIVYDTMIAHAERNSVEQFSDRVKAALPQTIVDDIRKVYLTPSFTWLVDFNASGCNLKADLDKAEHIFSKYSDAISWKYSYKKNALSLISSSVPHLFVSLPYSSEGKVFNNSLLKEAETGRYVLTFEITKNETSSDEENEDDLFAILGDTESKYSVKWYVYDRVHAQQVPLTRAVADIVNADKAITTVLELVNPSQKTNWLALCDRVREGLKSLMKADAYEVFAAKLLWLAKIKYSYDVREMYNKLPQPDNHSYDLRFTGWAFSSDKAMVQRIASVLKDHDINVSNPMEAKDELRIAICSMNKTQD